MKHIKTLKIDIDKKNFEVIPSVQYDSNTRFLHIQLLNNSVPCDITGCSVILSGVKEDGTSIFNSCDVINPEIAFIQAEITEQMNVIPGLIDCEIKIYDGEGVLTSKKFTIKVTASQTSRSVVSSNEFKALTDALNKVQAIDNKAEKAEVKKLSSQLDKKANELSNRIDNIVANAGDGTKDTEIIDARGGDTCLNNRLVGIENGEYINEISFNKIKKARPKGEIYTIDNFNTWSKWSAVSADVNKVTSLDNGGIEIAIKETLTSNLVVSKNGVNLQGKKLTLKFDITVKSTISDSDRFTLSLNDSITLKTIYLSEFKIGKTTTVSIDFNDNKLLNGKLALVLNKPCSCRLENLKLEECMTIEGYQTLEEVVTDVEELKLKSQNIKDFILPSVIPAVKEFETNIFWDNILLNTNIKSVERIDIANSIGGRNNVMEDRWRIYLPSNTTDITQTFNIYFNDTKNISKTIKADVKVLDKNIGSGQTRKIIFIGDSLTDNNVYEPELLNLFKNDVMNIELLGSRGNAPNLHEGRAGWTTKHYCTQSSFNNRTNAFWNPSTSKFDFSYYMNNQNYANVDYVFINMGTNDMANSNTETLGYFTEMLNSIKAFNSNIVVFVGLCPPLSSRSDTYGYKNKRIELMQMLLNKFDKRQDERILINPLVLNIDAANGFPTQLITGTRHSEELKVLTDNTHPLNSEYFKMADTIYCSIKYAASLGY